MFILVIMLLWYGLCMYGMYVTIDRCKCMSICIGRRANEILLIPEISSAGAAAGRLHDECCKWRHEERTILLVVVKHSYAPCVALPI